MFFCWLYPTSSMGLLPDTYNCGLCIRRECPGRFPRHRLQRKPLVSDPGMHHDTCVMHVPWCMSGSLTSGEGENVHGIPGACATPNFMHLARGPLSGVVRTRCNGARCLAVSQTTWKLSYFPQNNTYINLLSAELFWGNMKIYLQLISFLYDE